ncbi:phosphoribosylformylglycinamidine synthase subunit PurS [Candidatus Bathyarchaeota archaeon]|nr:phosphoribosylformylglycinamidine synthase subunit PurS [Candidatus Bathyarchaeota archaeon]
MKYRLRIEVGLKPGHSDPEGETTANLLRELGYRVEGVNVSKVYHIIVEASSKEDALGKGEEMCRRLLANPTKDDYTITVEEQL